MSESSSDAEPEIIRDLQDENWVCGVHGELDIDDLAVSVGGDVLCNFCAINAEMQPRRDDIDPRVSIQFDHDKDLDRDATPSL